MTSPGGEAGDPSRAAGSDAVSDVAGDDERQRAHRAFGLVVVGMCVAVWWPAFTLGAWDDLFFDQMLTVWVAATAGAVVVLVQPRSMGRRCPRVLALAVPSLWLALFFLVARLGADDADPIGVLVTLLGALIGLAGLPFTLWTLCRVLWPDLFTALRRRARWGVAAIVVAMAIASFLLGTAQSRFLTCEDFDVSGNSRPPGCVVETS